MKDSTDPPEKLPEEAFLVSLLSLPGMGPARLERLLEKRSPSEVWEALRSENSRETAEIAKVNADLARRWIAEAGRADVAGCWKGHCEDGVRVIRRGGERYPWRLSQDSEAPSALFAKGSLEFLRRPAVTIVGTRTCTRYGAEVAFELGQAAAERGIVVISGLAAGIDAAAHSGALEVDGAPVVGVVGSGLDRVYPKSNRALWKRVGERGLMLSEAPLGSAPERWRFPARNRIMAALADVCVVVESHSEGGSLTTAVEAAKRGRVVMAVPGHIRSPSSAGTNRLIADGCGVICEIDDLFTVMDIATEALPVATRRDSATAADTASETPETEVDEQAVKLLGAFEWMPATLETLAERTSSTLGEVAGLLERLIAEGKIVQRGLWYERRSLY